jgi:hypothetical protein
MLEKHLAEHFKDIFRRYHIWIPNDRSAGWPDRGIQIHSSRIVWFELKMCVLRFENTTISIDLDKQQAAWLAKWQMNGGFCYLFLGLTNTNHDLQRYAILRCGKWSTWLNVPNKRINIEQLLLFEDQYSVLTWFEELFIPQARKRA